MTSSPLLIAAFDRALIAFSIDANRYALMHRDLVADLAVGSEYPRSIRLSPSWRQPLIERFGRAPSTGYVRDYRGTPEPPGLSVGLWRDRLHNLVFPAGWRPADSLTPAMKRSVFMTTLAAAALCSTGQMSALVAFANRPLSTRTAISDPQAFALEVAHNIERFATLIPFKIECLTFASAVTRTLRALGIPAELVLGIANVPFAAHAWCQLGDTPLAEISNIHDELAVIFRGSDVAAAA